MKEYFKSGLELQRKYFSSAPFNQHIDEIIKKIIKALKKGGKLLIAGNGGSAADAQHLAAELVVKYDKKRPPLAAISLTTDTSIITACGNDFDFSRIFSRQIKALAKKDDVFLAFSTSGNSENIIEGLKEARKMGMVTIGFLGKNGGNAANFCDLKIIVPSGKTSYIQEVHGMIIHLICEMIDEELGNLR